jgi:hypothetical protein
MAILKGKDLLDKVRRKIKDESYGSFDEINEAQELIAEKTSFWWLRKSNIVGAGLEPSTKEYSLNLSDVKSIENIWITASSTTSVGTITGITLPSGSEVIITIASHGISSGRQVTFSNVGGTTELNSSIYRMTSTGTNTFTLDGTDGDNFTAWTSGGTSSVYDIDDVVWDQMTEAPARLFNDNVIQNTDVTYTTTSGVVTTSTTNTDTNRSDVQWSYYLKGGDAPFGKFVVSPTPSQVYKIKVDYLRLPVEITEEIKPDIPTAYHRVLAEWAAGLVLERETDPLKITLGQRYISRASSRLLNLVINSQRNRGKAIDRLPAPWKF